MRILVYFVWHTEAQSNIDPLFQGEVNTLMTKGQKQAAAVSSRFKDFPLERIYTSTALRAWLTGDEIARVVKKESVELDLLKERKSVYSSVTEYHRLESFESLLKRLDEAKNFFEHLPLKRIAIISHAIFLKSFAAYIALGNSISEEQLLKVSDALVIDHGAISVLNIIM